MRVRAVTMRYCPNDRELGVPMYPAPCRFSRGSFQETLAAGYWPNGCVFEYAVRYRGPVTRWQVNGHCLLEIGGDRVVRARLVRNQYVTVELIDAALAAKGVMG